MQTADFIALTVMALSGLWGFFRGFSTEFFSLCAWAGALVLTFRLYPLAVPYIEPHVVEHIVAIGIAFASTFVLLLLVFNAAANHIGRLIRSSLLGGADRLLGVVFGLARGYVLLVVGFLVLRSFFGSWADLLTHGSVIAPYIAAGTHYLEGIMPEGMHLRLASPPTTGHDAVI
ncbi:CvpA family protein [Kozakia baliensis]|uniref:CvpA family protein n=1 Tax=Kozakia baliensis TaxID=153496 RepID=UPI000691A11D|nr:CvpA family protein [Kozakia baliensis]AOX19959.1 hypothetical protein A0U90_06290 [Kozakia baliensis]